MANMGNLGIGLASAIDGFERGMGIGDKIQGVRRQRRLRQTAQEGTEQARTSRENDITSQIRTNGLGGFQVGDQTFQSEADARKAAEGNVDSMLDYYGRDVMPRLRDAYLADGDIEKAEAFEKWNQDRDVQKGQRSWARGMRAYAAGDLKGAANAFVDAWNIPGYGMGGVKDARPIERDGETVGFEFDIDDGNGGVRTHKMQGDQLIRQGIMSLAPNQMFETLYSEQKAADEARVKDAAEARKQGLTLEREVAVEDVRQGNRVQLEGVRQGNAVELATIRAQLDQVAKTQGADSPIMRDYNARVAILTQSGMPEEQARSEAASRTIHRLSLSPQDRVRETMSDLAKTDLRFSRLSREEQLARVREVIAMEDQLAGEMAGGGAAAPQAGSSPQPIGRQGGSAGGVPYYDPATGETRYR